MDESFWSSHLVDVIVIGIIFISALLALFRGFIRETLTIVSLGGATMIAIFFLPIVRPTFQSISFFENSETMADLAAGGALFFGSLTILSVITYFVSKLFSDMGLGFVDRLLGFVFGLVRGYLSVILIFMVYNYMFPDGHKEKYLKDAFVTSYLEAGATELAAMMPEGTLGDYDDITKESDSSDSDIEAIEEREALEPIEPVVVETIEPAPVVYPDEVDDYILLEERGDADGAYDSDDTDAMDQHFLDLLENDNRR